MSGKIYRVPALEKGLDILEALADGVGPMTLTDLSEFLGRGGNEIFRMISCLQSRGYLRRANGGGYELSMKLLALAQKIEPVHTLVEAASGEMRRLGKITGESCHLGILEGADLVVIHRNESPKPVRLAVEVGGRFPAICTVSGRLLLSALPPEESARVLQSDPGWLDLPPKERRALKQKLELIRCKGVSTAVGETVKGVADVAVGCGYPGTKLFASLAISMLSPSNSKIDPGKLTAPLKECAERIQANLGNIEPNFQVE